MNGFLSIQNIRVSQEAIDRMMDVFRQRGGLGLEAFALWAGNAEDDIFTVHELIIPAQTGQRLDEGVCVFVGPAELHRINVWLYENQMSLIAQIHTHPDEAYHSETDDAFPIATTVGCVSIVIPNFARQPFSIGRCAVYRLNELKEWEYLDGLRPSNLITIVK